MNDPKAQTSVSVFTCPACEQEVHARVTYSVALGDADYDAREVPVKATPVGFQIAHDCTPKATR